MVMDIKGAPPNRLQSGGWGWEVGKTYRRDNHGLCGERLLCVDQNENLIFLGESLGKAFLSVPITINERHRPLSSHPTTGEAVPLLVEKHGARVAVGVQSALLSADWDGHSLHRLMGKGRIVGKILNDYILRRNLRDEHQLIRSMFNV